MGSPEVRVPQKTIPDHGQHGEIKAPHHPDIPIDREQILRKLAIRIPPGQKPPTGINGGFDVQEVNKDGGHGRDATLVRLTPKVEKPLTPVFQTKIEGHIITGGGGTSREALRRAKQKAKKQRK